MTSWAIRRKSDGKFFKTNQSNPDFTDSPLKTYRTLAHARSSLSNGLNYHRHMGKPVDSYEIVRLETTVVAVEE
jgi:hypothetical protein